MRWRESVPTWPAQGVEPFVEIGAGKVLGGLIKRIAEGATVASVGAPADVEAFSAQPLIGASEPRMFDLTGRNALVTGASGGLGGAIARALHGQGASVALSGTRRDALEALAHELGARASVLPCDLADAAAVEALVPAAEAAMGGLDILVNNAGVTRDNLFMRMKDAEWDTVHRRQSDGGVPARARQPQGHDAPPPRPHHRRSLRSSASPAIPARAITPPPRRA